MQRKRTVGELALCSDTAQLGTRTSSSDKKSHLWIRKPAFFSSKFMLSFCSSSTHLFAINLVYQPSFTFNTPNSLGSPCFHDAYPGRVQSNRVPRLVGRYQSRPQEHMPNPLLPHVFARRTLPYSRRCHGLLCRRRAWLAAHKPTCWGPGSLLGHRCV